MLAKDNESKPGAIRLGILDTHDENQPAEDADKSVFVAPLQSIRVSPRDCSALAVRAALTEDVNRLLQNESAARRFDAEGVHQMRAAVRRLRSDLSTFQPLVDEDWAEHLSDKLHGLARLLGDVRDADVLLERIRMTSNGLSSAALEPLFLALNERLEKARAALDQAFGSTRYRELLAELIEAARNPATTEFAEVACRKALPTLVADVAKDLKRAGRELGKENADDRYHHVRKLAKRARYAAEAVAPALGKQSRQSAKRFARRAAGVQDVLGEVQDAAVACQAIGPVWVEQEHNDPFRHDAARLLQRQDRAAADARDRFPEVWAKLDRKRNRAWLET